jgi:hypothetical protein
MRAVEYSLTCQSMTALPTDHEENHRISTSPNTSTRFVILKPNFSNSRILGLLDSEIRVTRLAGGMLRGDLISDIFGADSPFAK